MPSIGLPSGVDPAGLPLSVQLVGALFAESRLLGAARWCEGVLGFSAVPAL
jgi:Asp-tRNA(Asn)/Glu-tRNA(Gln) amidotransferase A subunit family amidase